MGMKTTETDAWVVYTDFSDDPQWQNIYDLIAVPQRDGDLTFYTYVHFFSDSAYTGRSPAEIVCMLPDDSPYYFCFVVDQQMRKYLDKDMRSYRVIFEE